MACVYLFVGMRYMCILCRHAHRKAKMAPVLSPKKSVEGGIGGIAGAALIGVLYALAVNHWGNAGASIVSYAVIGAVGGAISQIGDLAASAIKRYHNIKDYGKSDSGSWRNSGSF